MVMYVDLTSGTCNSEAMDPNRLPAFLGGRGLGDLLLWQNLPRNTDPFSPDNVLVFSTGLLVGTNAPTAGRSCVLTRSPLTKRYLKSSAGGHFGTALRLSGCEHLVIRGAAEFPTYLEIRDGVASLRDARELWGKGTRETTQALEARAGALASVACIGPAGENRVRFASIVVDYYCVAARGGAGAVMGSKNLKAIVAVAGARRIRVAHERGFSDVVAEARERLYADPSVGALHEYGTSAAIPVMNEMHLLPSYNFTRAHFASPHLEELGGEGLVRNGYLKARRGCSGCIIGCHRYTEVHQGAYAGTFSGGPQLETITKAGPNCGVDSVPAILRYNEICNDLGLDTSETGSCIAWLMETYAKGVVAPASLRGRGVRWGDSDCLVGLAEQIARRAGIGDVLAEGLRAAAESLGGGSWKWAMQANGMSVTGIVLQATYAYALAYAVNPRGPDHLHSQTEAELALSRDAIQLIERITGSKEYARPSCLEKRAEIVRWHEDIFAVSDALGICAFATTSSYAIDEEICARLFQAATGIQMDAKSVMECGRRIVTLERAFNVREGFARSEDTLPWRIMNERNEDTLGVEDPIVTQEKLDVLLDSYYALHGWDNAGRPTAECLRTLGLAGIVAGM
jgi:aldehyde:ferredoxin oxidoreductase